MTMQENITTRKKEKYRRVGENGYRMEMVRWKDTEKGGSKQELV